MTKIINIRGTNGSGKSTIVRGLISPSSPDKFELAIGENGKPIYAHHLVENGIAIGKYNNACGGCDTIKTQADMRKAIANAITFSPSSYVLFEGIIVSTIFSSWAEFASNRKKQFIFAYLDTPLETCIARVQARNGGKPVKEDLIKDKFLSIHRTRKKFEEVGFRTVTISDGKDILKLIRGE